MFDWNLLFAPFLLLPILWLLVFMGCVGKVLEPDIPESGMRDLAAIIFTLQIPAELGMRGPTAMFYFAVDGGETESRLVGEFTPDGTFVLFTHMERSLVGGEWMAWCDLFTGSDDRRWPYASGSRRCLGRAESRFSPVMFSFEARRKPMTLEWEVVPGSCPSFE